MVNWADVPSVVPLAGQTLVAQWLVDRGKHAYDAVAAVSRDGGASWTAPRPIHGDGLAAEHGFVSIVPRAAGGAALVWLDGRGYAAAGDAKDAAMQLMQADLSADGALGPESIVDERVCDCCQTAATPTPDGILVAYRDRSRAEVRDVSLAHARGGVWSAPRTPFSDQWTITGCPVNGPALATSGRTVALAWYAAPKEEARVQVALSRDGGSGFGTPVRIDEGNPIGRVDVTVDGTGAALVTWLETSGAQAEIRLRRVSGTRAEDPVVVTRTGAARASGVPRVESTADGAVVAWTDASAGRVRTARVVFP